MSYILDALKKSDQQRQRDAMPPLQPMQVTAAAPKRKMSAYYGLLAAVLLGAGVMVGWLRPWQPEQPPAEAASIAAEAPIPVTQQDAPLPAPTGTFGKTEVASAAEPARKESSMLAEAAQEQQATPFDELPLQIQQEIPDMKVQLHAYANNPSERLVSINDIRLREGGSLMSGLRLEQITPDGMIFSYKGYRFQRGIRY
ncbi:MAG: general secretion pathway protein GspB [Pseudomonadota bacterium]